MKRFQEPMRPIAHFATAAALALIALEAFVREQAELYERLATSLGIRE